MTPRPKRSLGQNFLVDSSVKRRMAEMVLAYHGHTLVEIGPGPGALTELLVPHFSSCHLIEKDKDLARELEKRFPQASVYNEDILEWSGWPKTGPVIVVGNLPYNISSQILIGVLPRFETVRQAFFMFQREVAERVVSKPDTSEYGMLRLWTDFYSTAQLVLKIPPDAFRPRPRVDSAVVHFTLKDHVPLGPEKAQAFFAWMRYLFRYRRKTLGSSLNKILGFRPELQGFENAERIETMPLSRLLDLFRQLPLCPSDA
jgi:16S rRNA (adenine1518-N6/adenine1519-N6)-dimethyltransferase